MLLILAKFLIASIVINCTDVNQNMKKAFDTILLPTFSTHKMSFTIKSNTNEM